MTEEFKPPENTLKLAEFMEWYAGQLRIRPAEEIKWQHRLIGTEEWLTTGESSNALTLYRNREYRPAPHMVTINGVELVAPRLSTGVGTNKVYHKAFSLNKYAVKENPEMDLKLGVECWDTKEDCQAYIDVMNKIARGA